MLKIQLINLLIMKPITCLSMYHLARSQNVCLECQFISIKIISINRVGYMNTKSPFTDRRELKLHE